MEDRGPNELAREQSHDQRNDASPHGYQRRNPECFLREFGKAGGYLWSGRLGRAESRSLVLLRGVKQTMHHSSRLIQGRSE